MRNRKRPQSPDRLPFLSIFRNHPPSLRQSLNPFSLLFIAPPEAKTATLPFIPLILDSSVSPFPNSFQKYPFFCLPHANCLTKSRHPPMARIALLPQSLDFHLDATDLELDSKRLSGRPSRP
jgi:hypothetical protein